MSERSRPHLATAVLGDAAIFRTFRRQIQRPKRSTWSNYFELFDNVFTALSAQPRGPFEPPAFPDGRVDNDNLQPELQRWITFTYENDFVIPYDWSSWYTSRVRDGNFSFQTPEEAMMYIAAVCRADRWLEGTLEKKFHYGDMWRALCILRFYFDPTFRNLAADNFCRGAAHFACRRCLNQSSSLRRCPFGHVP